MGNIPHIIHYCWFGGNPLPEKIIKYIDSWKEKLPDWQIMCWNEENFDVNHSVPYVQDAYSHKKYAFVSDYARLNALYQYGGLYLDTDVEMVKNPEDILSQGNEDMVAGFESVNHVMTAFIACSEKHRVIKEFLDIYENLSFALEDGSINDVPNPVYFTEVLKQYGLVCNNQEQVLDDGRIHIYADDYFSGQDMENSHPKITEHTHTIHHFLSSWKKEDLKTRIKYGIIVKGIQKIIGYDRYDRLKEILKI